MGWFGRKADTVDPRAQFPCFPAMGERDAMPRSYAARVQEVYVNNPVGQLDAGFSFPADKIRVHPKTIDRMFISLVPPGFVPGDDSRFSNSTTGQVTISDIRCDGSGSVLSINDAIVPPHELRI